MAEGTRIGPTCHGMGSRQDPVSSSGSCNFPEYELPELNTRAFYVGAFGELWRGRLRGEGDLSLKEPQASALPGSQGVAEWGQEDAAVARDLGCSLEAAAELRTVCGLDKLKCLEEGEDPEVIPEDTDLVTLGVRKRLLEQREETITIDRVCRQETFAYEMESHAIGKKPENPADMVEEGELILSVNILYPVIFHKHKEHKPYQTMLVLGSQKLTELRDSICCVSDLQIGGEFSNTPDQAPEHISKDLYKSAFFYFEGTFYNDKRYPECRDLSRYSLQKASVFPVSSSQNELSLSGQSPMIEAMENFRPLKWKILPSMTCILNWVFLTYIVTRETVSMLSSSLT
ncbi:snRNA-activating protein complex subunit 3 isoform X2 [Lynx rufus]|uniref:snRNA-activating protein complex subunit 3 isoform X2 n=1 Tax=Lynx rufus TaxID=61384 RepID=UPI001F127B03|nr:snRNA-activating protein complex subunit 3 isoform X2 [Lynx rufus]